MKRVIIGTAAFLLTIGMMPSQAQDGPPQFRPVEMWVCSFLDGRDQDDMDDVYEEIVEAAGDIAYSAFQLTPYITGNLARDADLIYLGAWEDGAVMGADMNSYLGGDDFGWDETVDCQGLMFASNQVQTLPAAGDEGGPFVVLISDCEIAHGHSGAQAVGAISRFNDYRVANGQEIGTIVWFPFLGGGDAEFDFKLVNPFPSAQHMGDYFKWSVDNAAYNVSNQMMEGIVDCDEARLYYGRTIMNNMAPPAE